MSPSPSLSSESLHAAATQTPAAQVAPASHSRVVSVAEHAPPTSIVPLIVSVYAPAPLQIASAIANTYPSGGSTSVTTPGAPGRADAQSPTPGTSQLGA